MKHLAFWAMLFAVAHAASASPPARQKTPLRNSRTRAAPSNPAKPVTPKAVEPAWGTWVYLQGDKAVQYRVAKVGQEGETALLKTQFRVEPGNRTACYSDRCEGYVVYLAVIDPDKRSTMAEHHLFFPRGTGAMWVLPEVQRFTAKRTDWGRLYLDDQNLPSLAHTDTPDEHTRIRIFDTSCADDRMAGVETRCSDYKPALSQTIGN